MVLLFFLPNLAESIPPSAPVNNELSITPRSASSALVTCAEGGPPPVAGRLLASTFFFAGMNIKTYLQIYVPLPAFEK